MSAILGIASIKCKKTASMTFYQIKNPPFQEDFYN
jgi:hypothetical protein